MGTIKDRNGMDLTETEDVKKRWQEYTEELYKKDLNDPGPISAWAEIYGSHFKDFSLIITFIIILEIKS